jgi:hypothetical protein
MAEKKIQPKAASSETARAKTAAAGVTKQSLKKNHKMSHKMSHKTTHKKGFPGA